MKRFYRFLMPLVAIVAMALPWNVQAQVTCDSGDPVVVSNADTATSTSNYIPGYSYYNYSFSEVLILADDLMGIGDIKALQFKPASTLAGSYFTNCEIYLANTDLEDLSAGFLNDASAFELVWSGNMSYTSTDWQTIVFDTPFAWDGTSNVVVAVRRNHGQWTSGSSFVAFNAGATMGRYANQDSGPYTIGSLPSGSGTSTVAWYKLIGCEGTGDYCYRVRNVEVSDITSDGFTLSWTDTLNSGATYLVYDMSDSSVLATAYTSPCILTGLNSNTLYQLAVLADCGTSTSSYSRFSVRTACGGYTAVPFAEGFEGLSTGQLPNCWQQIQTGTSGSGTFPSAYAWSNARTGNVYFEFESNSGQTEVAALPAMENISTLKLTFWASLMNHNFTLEVGVMEDSLFVPVDTIDNLVVGTGGNWHGSYHEYTVYFSNYSGSGEQMAMRVTSSGSYTLMLDDFSISEDNGCYPLSNLHLEAADSANITIAWSDEMNNGISYTVTYWSNGDTVVDYASDTFYTASNLVANTNYHFMVTPNCSMGDGVPVTGSFRTTCGMIPMPFFDDFDSYASGQFPPCWQRIRAHGTDPSVNNVYHHSGSQSMFLMALSDTTLFCTPSAVPLPGNMIKVSYYAYMGYSSYMNYVMWIKAGVMTNPNDMSTFIPLDSVGYHNFNNVFEEREFNTSHLDASAEYYVAWMYYSNNNTYRGAVDDVSIIENTGCNRPQTAFIDNVGARSATFSWPSVVGANGYTVTYATVNDPTAASALTASTYSGSDTTLTVTGLQPTTQYYAWVATDCSSSEQSDLRSIGSFTTLVSCPPVTGLTVDTVTTDGATISWTAGDVETQWYVVLDSTVIGVVSDTFYTVTGLLPMTGHTLYVRAYCDVDDTSAVSSISFATRCADATCNVTLNMSDTYGDGWNGCAIQVWQAGVMVGSGTIPSGSSNTEVVEVCSSEAVELRFVLGSYASEMGGTVTDGAGLTVFTIANMSSYSNGAVLATVATPCPACIPPMNLALTASDSVSLSFSWDADATATGYLVTFDGTTQVVSTNSFTATGLNSNALYTLSVSTLCAIGDTSAAMTLSGRTACGTVAIPYATDFEDLSTGQLPSCWAAMQTGTSGSGTFPSAYSHAPNARNGNLYFEFESNSGQTEVVALPAMDNISSLMLSFWASLMNTNFTLEVGVMEGSSFVPVDTVNLIAGSGSNWHGSYHEYEIPFTSYTGTGNRMAMRVTGTGSYTLMMDDLGVSVNTGCPRPDQPVVTGVLADQISVSFGGSTTGDYRLYITDGATFTDSVSVSADSTYTFTGLNPVTTYTIDVHADCGSALSNPRSVSATTTMVADTLPYSTGFEAGQDISWMLVNGTQTNQWVVDSATGNGSSHALYISDNNGVSNSYTVSSSTNVYATKLFTFDAGDYAISYDWMANGESCCDYLRVFLAPGTVEPAAGNAGGIGTSGAPSGWMALDGGNKLNQASSWQNYNEVFSIPATGNYMLVFFWHNDGSVGTNPPAAIDNVQITALSCPQPVDVVVDAVTDATASLHWTPVGSETEWTVTCNGVTTTVTTPNAVVSGLEASHRYSVAVRAVCGMGDTSFAASADFVTDMCASAVTVENFDGTAAATTSSYSPVGYSLYDYSYVQTIIPADRMDANGSEITAMGFKPAAANTAGSYFTNMDVYMANVSEDDLSSAFILSDSSHQFVHVISNGNFNYDNTDWQLHALDTSFIWDGHSNVLVAVHRAHGTWSSGSSFSAHNDTVARSRYIYQDAGGYDITSVSGGTATNTVGDIRLISCGGVNCYAPSVGSPVAAETTVTLTWSGRAATYEVAAVAGSWSEPSAPVTVTGTTATLSGLIPGTFYSVGVRAVCDESMYSEWVVDTVTTIAHPCLAPSAVTATNPTLNGATIAWTLGEEGQSLFQLRLSTAGDTTLVEAQSNPFTLSGLMHQTTYSVAVRAVCSEGFYSDWSAATTFTTSTCQPVSNVAVTARTQTSATITWTAGSNSNGNYEVEYGLEGFSQGNGTRVSVAGTSYTLTGLEAGVSYSVYVRSQCAEGVFSGWDNGTNFTTTEEIGIDDIDDARISLYPNPASGTVTLTGIEGAAKVTVVDMNGREVQTIKHSGNQAMTIDVSGMAQGAYFVRITGEKVNAIRKLIVR